MKKMLMTVMIVLMTAAMGFAQGPPDGPPPNGDRPHPHGGGPLGVVMKPLSENMSVAAMAELSGLTQDEIQAMLAENPAPTVMENLGIDQSQMMTLMDTKVTALVNLLVTNNLLTSTQASEIATKMAERPAPPESGEETDSDT